MMIREEGRKKKIGAVEEEEEEEELGMKPRGASRLRQRRGDRRGHTQEGKPNAHFLIMSKLY